MQQSSSDDVPLDCRWTKTERVELRYQERL
jgi:hypothetical protein